MSEKSKMLARFVHKPTRVLWRILLVLKNRRSTNFNLSKTEGFVPDNKEKEFFKVSKSQKYFFLISIAKETDERFDKILP